MGFEPRASSVAGRSQLRLLSLLRSSLEGEKSLHHPFAVSGHLHPLTVTSASSLFKSAIPLLVLNRPCGTRVTCAQGFEGLRPQEVWPPPKPFPPRARCQQQPRPGGRSNPADARIRPLPRMGRRAGRPSHRGTRYLSQRIRPCRSAVKQGDVRLFARKKLPRLVCSEIANFFFHRGKILSHFFISSF